MSESRENSLASGEGFSIWTDIGRLAYVSTAFRNDIQGLRAVAVLLVLLYHGSVPYLSAGFVGVDVFFVLSGYLITGLLVRELETTGTIRLLDFYAKRARRLLPASFTVLGAVSAVLFIVPRWIPDLIIPQLYGRSISWDIQRSGLYVVNWLFAERAVDYHSTDVPSPLQHFWSLSVEEQFYAVWPLLILAVGVAAASLGVRRTRRTLLAVLTIITVLSFAYSYWYSIAEPARAYFVTTTRIWEMSSGAMLAVLLPGVIERLRGRLAARRIAPIATVSGLATILGSSVLIGASTPFPGIAALLPVGGTLALLAGGALGSTPGVTRLLESSPIQWIGERSYSLYLWHWPVLWFAMALFGTLSVMQSVLAIALSFLPAALSYRWIEQPLRHHRVLRQPIRGVALGGFATVAAYMLGAMLLQTTTNVEQTVAAAETVPQIVEVLGVQVTAEDITPNFIDAREELPAGYASGCFDEFLCPLGNPNAETHVLILGNSHAAHWVPTLEHLAGERDWRLTVMAASGCRTAIGAPSASQRFERCETWPDAVRTGLSAIVDDQGVDLVLVSENRILHDPTDVERAHLTNAYIASWDYLGQIDVPVAVVRPVPGGNVVGLDCPSLLVGDLVDCALPIEEAINGERPIIDAAAVHELAVLDLTDYFCVDGMCPAVIDDILVRRDDNHLTVTFARAMADAFGKRLDQLIHDRSWDEALTAR